LLLRTRRSSIAELVRVQRQRHRIEEVFEVGNGEAGFISRKTTTNGTARSRSRHSEVAREQTPTYRGARYVGVESDHDRGMDDHLETARVRTNRN
jgi:hypothetical protein